jgi:hypothetical protein
LRLFRSGFVRRLGWLAAGALVFGLARWLGVEIPR